MTVSFSDNGARGMLTTVRSYFAAMIKGQSPGWIGALTIGLIASALTLGVRLAIEYFVDGVIIFALVYPAAAAATLIGGGRAGLTTITVSQVFIWYFLLPVHDSFRFATPGDVVSLVLATLSQLVIVWAIASYKHAATRLTQSEARRGDDLKVALRELDHRTMNNFQLSVAVLRSQSRRSAHPAVTAGLTAAADRLLVLAALHRNLDYSHESLDRRQLVPLLAEVVGALQEQLPSESIKITTDFVDVSVTHDTALRLGLLTNELVTNALKHAFPDGVGHIAVRVAADSDCIVLEIADNGAGMPKTPIAGHGTTLVESLAKSIGATISYRSDAGTTVTVRCAADAEFACGPSGA